MEDTRQTPTVTKASWDEINTGILLQLLVDEIDAGNRPSGQFTRQAWANITVKFGELSGCNFTQPQLENKWDNLKKDFSTWEKLRIEKSDLGYDYSTGKIMADPAWWRQKIQERPEYKKFRTHGPVHLELQERVFRGHVATGYMKYIPTRHSEDVFNNTSSQHMVNDDPVVDEAQTINVNAEETTTDCNVRNNLPHLRSSTHTEPASKRKRSRRSSKGPSQGDVHANMNDLIDKWHEQAESSIRVQTVAQNAELSYDDSLLMLSSLPWINESSQDYLDAMVLLEDPLKWVTLRHIKDRPKEFVKGWIRKLQDKKTRRLF